jgi:ArsR family transcriptional regulator, arsenate/arsenite/antimonite-responsive transcriptional repressor
MNASTVINLLSLMEHPDLVFKALSDPIRLRALEFLRRPVVNTCSVNDTVCACDLETVLGIAQPTVSHHMKLLVQAGLVSAEKRGRWVYYRINQDAFTAAMDYLAGFTGQPSADRSSPAPRSGPASARRRAAPNRGASA